MSRVDTTNSIYSESPTAKEDFDRHELRHARLLLRRLHFLESKVNANGGLGAASGNGGEAFAEWELAALEWVLKDIGYIHIKKENIA
jgi:hypothetical protein